MLVAAAVLLLPGLAVVAAATRLRLASVAVAPAITVALLGVSGVIWGALGQRWNLVAVLVVTAVVAAVAYAVRRALNAEVLPDLATDRRGLRWSAAGLVMAGLLSAAQVVRGVGSAVAISQTFDVSFHLNAVEHIVATGNGSIFGLGDFTGNAYYPLGWHQFAALVVELTGTSIPAVAHAVNIAIAAVAWPLGVIGLVSVVFPRRPWLLAVAGVLSAGFGAFPFRLLEYGVVYPNLLANALIPALLAVVVVIFTPDGIGAVRRSAAAIWIWALLLVTAVVGTAFAQPNGVLSTLALALPVVLWSLGRRVRGRVCAGMRGPAIRLGAVAVVVLAASGFVWQVVRPPIEDNWWPPGLSVGQALRSTLQGAPGIRPWSWAVALLLVVGLFALARSGRRLWVAGPFVTAAFLYVVVDACRVPALRMFFTGVYFNDPPRVAALVPVGAVLVGTAGAAQLLELLRWLGARRALAARPRVARAGAVVVALALAWGLAPGNDDVTATLWLVRRSYAPTGNLLTVPERRVLDRLADVPPPDALIAVNPNTGAALAYAVSGRRVTEPHIYSTPTRDELFLAKNLARIDEDPAVCEAVARVGVDYVIDFGTHPVFPGNVPHDYSGYAGLVTGRHLELVLDEGPDAKLFRIVGC